LINNFLTYLINKNIVVSLAAFSLYKVTEILFNFNDMKTGFFVFFSTFTAYSYMKNISSLNHNKLFDKKTKELVLLAVFFLIITINFYDYYFLKLITPVIVISFLYPLNIRISNFTICIRSIPVFKVFLISLVWSYVTYLMPLIYNGFEIDTNILKYFTLRFLFIFAISIPFDIRDFNVDKILTFPRLLGIQKSKYLSWLSMLTFQLIILVDLFNSQISMPMFLALFLSIELSSLVIYYANTKRTNLFYGLLVEGLSIIMCLFVFITKFF
tara:strand:+ start:912 stop:1721 length:810 start_codon:yes stop_codon:yes gene_type:complete